MNLQAPQTPTHNPDTPKGGGGGKKPSNHKPTHHKPSQKPSHPKPSAHKPTHHRPSKPGPKGKKSSARDEVIVWFDDTTFKPLAKGGHIH